MAKKTFKQFQNDSKGLTDKQFGNLLDKKGVKRPDILKKIKEGRHPRDQKELDRAQEYIKKNPNFGKKKKVEEDLYQKRYAGVGKGYQTVGKNKRMDQSNKRSGDSKAQHRELHKDLAKYGHTKTGKQSNLKTALKKFNEESLADRIAAAADRNKASIKNKRGVAPAKKSDDSELKANNSEAERIVKGMERKSLGRFKNLYGTRHKEVMYNTANKLAS